MLRFFYLMYFLAKGAAESNFVKTACYEVPNLNTKIKLSAMNSLTHHLSYMKMKVFRTEDSTTVTREYVLKKLSEECESSFTFGKKNMKSEKTNITIVLLPIGFDVILEKFVVLVLNQISASQQTSDSQQDSQQTSSGSQQDSPVIKPPINFDVLGLQGKYTFTFKLQFTSTDLELQDKFDVPSDLPQLQIGQKYCIVGQLHALLGFINLPTTSEKWDIFGLMTLKLDEVRDKSFHTVDKYDEAVEFIPCTEVEAKPLYIAIHSQSPIILNMTLYMNGKKTFLSEISGSYEELKLVLFSKQVRIPISYIQLSAKSIKERNEPGQVILLKSVKSTQVCRINSQPASYSKWVSDNQVLRTSSIRFVNVATSDEVVVGKTMNDEDITDCNTWINNNPIPPVSDQ